jgi:uncharacterized protein
VDVLDVLDAATVVRWSQAAAGWLDNRRAEIDQLNVFPVADGDTGTNLAVTVRAGADALTAADPVDAAAALGHFARGAVLGARGNSGVILAQFLRGIADAAIAEQLRSGQPECTTEALRAGFRLGAEQARAAVAAPVEGTILTVADAVADAVATGNDLRDLLARAVRAGERAVQLTTGQLAELDRAGVVDAGGQGLVVVLAALEHSAAGGLGTAPVAPSIAVARRPVTPRESGSDGYEFEVQYLLDAPDDAVQQLRSELTGLGDSVAVVGTGDGTWNVHVHVNDVGAALEAGVAAGRPHRISVTRLSDGDAAGPTEPTDDTRSRVSVVVAVAPGAGLDHLFTAEGVHVAAGSLDDPPSSQRVLDVIHEAVATTGATRVVLLPNTAHVTGVAEAAARLARAGGLRVAVVPTRSPVQAFAAVAVHNADGDFDDTVVAMAEAAAATRYAEITVAEHESLTSAGVCQPGDILGLIDGEVVEIGRGQVAVSLALIDRLLGVGAEIMTALLGERAVAGLAGVIASHVHGRSPLTELSVYAAGQPDHPLIIGVE